MATKKKLLQAAAGTAAASGGAGALNVEDVFSTYLYEGNGSAQNINNGINLGDNIAGSVDFDGTGDSLKVTGGSFDYSGDLTVEFWVKFDTLGGTSQNIFDARASTGVANSFMIGTNTSNKMRLYAQNTSNYIEETNAPSTGVWYHYAVVRSSGTWTMYRDGASTGTPVSSDTNDYSSGTISIGQRSFTAGLELDGKLSNLRVVTGTAVYTANFTAPTEPLTNITNTAVLICTENNLEDEGPDKIAFTVIGNPTPSSESPFSGNTGEGGLVWIKDRLTTRDHMLNDTERGADKSLSTNRTGTAFVNYGAVTSFNSNGFSIGSESAVNASGTDLASFTFRKAPKFFDVVTYTGTGSATTISHNLGSVPACIIVKRTDSTGDWKVYHRAIHPTNNGSGYVINLNLTNARAATTIWSSTEPTSTEFSISGSSTVNASGGTYVAYLFAHNDGDGTFGPTGDQDIIKCGSFTSTSGTDEIDLGFEPQWILMKRADASNSWVLVDELRGNPVGSAAKYLEPNGAFAESTLTGWTTPTPTGFTNSYPVAGGTFIYIAIRRGPMAVPTAGTDVFAMDFPSTSGAWTVSSGFPVDFLIYGERVSGSSKYVFSRLNDPNYLRTDLTNAETGYTVNFDRMDGIEFPTTTGDYSTWINWMWRRAPSFFDVVAYTGTGSARTVSHNLGVAPEMIWVKKRNTADDWAVYHSTLGNTDNVFLNDTQATASRPYWNNTTPTDASFTLGSHSKVNNTNDTYIAYLFASVDGVSKVGSYTGTGAAQNIDCGFSSGARFVLIKRTDSSGYGWMVLDTERGIVAGNDPRLQLNTTDAEVSNADVIDPYSGGFALTSTGTSFNASGGSYIFYAIA